MDKCLDQLFNPAAASQTERAMRERETDIQAERQTEKVRRKERERQSWSQTERKRERKTNKLRDRQKETERQTKIERKREGLVWIDVSNKQISAS